MVSDDVSRETEMLDTEHISLDTKVILTLLETYTE